MKTREKRRQSGIGKDGNNSGDLKGPKRMRWGRKTRKETVERKGIGGVVRILKEDVSRMY